MIEIIIRTYLDSVLDVPVWLEEKTDATYVLLAKVGSSKSNQLTSSTFAFQSYSSSLYGAATLNDRVKEAVEGLTSLPEISSVKLNSDYNFTDTATKHYRYQAVFDIYHY